MARSVQSPYPCGEQVQSHIAVRRHIHTTFPMNDDPHAGSAPSTRFVRYVLEQEGSLSRHDLEAKTGLSEASVARALATLQDDGVVHKQRRSDDPRKVLYQIA